MEELQPGAGHLLIQKKDPGSEHVCFESVYIYIYRKKIEPFVLKVKSWMKPSEMEMQPAKKHSEFPIKHSDKRTGELHVIQSYIPSGNLT